MINGYDLGIVQQVTGSDDAVYHIDNALAEKIGKIEKKRSKYQRRYNRIAKANDRRLGKKRPCTKGERKALLAMNLGQIR